MLAPKQLRADIASEWMLEEGVDFLNHGAFGAVPRRVFDEQAEWRRRIEARPVDTLGRRCDDMIALAKRSVGGWLGMGEEDFGLVTNATEGVNAVLRSLDFRAGDELVTTSHVYNAVRQAMQYVTSRTGGTYREIPVPLPVNSPADVVSAVKTGLTDRTKLLVIDHVTSPTGMIFPVEQIVAACADRSVDVLIDGAHAPAQLELDVGRIGAAYYAGNLHKWACAPRGAGFLWVRPDRQEPIHPLIISHRLGEGLAREFAWQGTRDISAWLSVPAARGFLNDLGEKNVRTHNHALAAWAQQRLCERWDVPPISPADGSMIGSMASVPLPGRLATLPLAEAEAFQRHLYDRHRIEVPLHFSHDRWLLRVSCQVYNTAGQYERLAEVVRQER
ncbi:MAG TPA: aminotransferase class V-fold PLP-dependent enzyme [Tepidisphaeraceae bacterium]|nr:aminotransferase class V-fold PLP-dependent enzyme [Tepidisphaeraceae bacterium]